MSHTQTKALSFGCWPHQIFIPVTSFQTNTGLDGFQGLNYGLINIKTRI